MIILAYFCFHHSFNLYRRSKKPGQMTPDVEPDQVGDTRASPLAAAMDAWDDFAGIWEDHIWNMAASYDDADWTYMST